MSDDNNPQPKADLRHEIEALKAMADEGMGEDAPEANARAREKLLQLHRARFAANRHLDLENTEPLRKTGSGREAYVCWTMADLSAIEWICRLAGAGHIGAHRLLERALQFKYFPVETAAEECLLHLAKKHPPLARYIARMVCVSKDVDFRELAGWLDLGGPEAASIAAGIREIQSCSSDAELRLLRSFVEQAGRTPRLWNETDLQARRAGLLFDIAEQRLRGNSKDGRDGAQRLFELALNLFERGLDAGGSACLGAWLTAWESVRVGRAPDPTAALDRVNRWLASGGDAQSRDPQLALVRGRIRNRGESHVRTPKPSSTADPAIGAKWLHIGALIGDAESQYLLGGLYARGHGVERDPQVAREWLEKAAARGYPRAVSTLAKAERSVRAPAKLEGDPETPPLESAAAATLSGAEETDELLELVEVYLKMGDVKFARDMLDDLLLRGSDEQQERACQLFAAIAKK